MWATDVGEAHLGDEKTAPSAWFRSTVSGWWLLLVGNLWVSFQGGKGHT